MPAFFHWAETLGESERARTRPHMTYRALWRTIAELARSHPRVRVDEIGESAGGEPLWSVSIGAGDHAVFVMGGLHAMEHVGPATALALLERAARGAAGWDQSRLVVVPVANPDGYRAAESLLAQGSRRFVRRNKRGVDLNRNFAIGWNDQYYLNRLLRQVFAPGDAPLSEPETRAIDRLVADVRPDYAVSLHAFGEQIFYPFAGSDDRPPHEAQLRSVATRMAASQPSSRYAVMQLGRRSRLFKACGSEIDHFYGRYGALSFLIEIGAGPSLREPSTWLHPYRWFTPPRRIERDIANVLPALDVLSEHRATRE